ncbi:sugar transferase [Georgenia sp. AZ-5]|uniref:sugar transferase n=1 Tax=Georgenia sp. AZ-5 TaxID=3367526 RepID=UPI00375428F9
MAVRTEDLVQPSLTQVGVVALGTPGVLGTPGPLQPTRTGIRGLLSEVLAQISRARARSAPPQLRRYQVRALALDASTAFAAVVVVGAVMQPEANVIPVAGVFALALALFVAAHGGYAAATMGAGTDEFWAVLRGGAFVALALLAVVHLTGDAVPVHALAGALPLALGAITVARLVQRAVVRQRRRNGLLALRTVVVGEREHLEPLLASLLESPAEGFSVVGACMPVRHDGTDSEAPLTVPTLGGLDDLPRVVRETGAEIVIVASGSMTASELRQRLWSLEGASVRLMLSPNLHEVGTSRLRVRPAAGAALLEVALDAPGRRVRAKALFDRVFGAVLLLCASTVLLPAALLVRLTSPGPAFFRQTRIGADGRPFTMFKLRSMTTDAEARLVELSEHSDGNGTLFKMRQDPRVTPVGKVLRRYSIDELPQLWNVVRGDMSLVGPRPPLPAETEKYDAAAHRRLKVKPGLTGLWQVSGRSDLSWEQSVRLDLRYVDNWSVPMDLAILVRTVSAVFGGRGAY